MESRGGELKPWCDVLTVVRHGGDADDEQARVCKHHTSNERHAAASRNGCMHDTVMSNLEGLHTACGRTGICALRGLDLGGLDLCRNPSNVAHSLRPTLHLVCD